MNIDILHSLPENIPFITGDSYLYKELPPWCGFVAVASNVALWQDHIEESANQKSEEVRVTDTNAKTSFLFQWWRRQKRFAWRGRTRRGPGIKLFSFRQGNRTKGERIERYMWQNGHGLATVCPICVFLVFPIPSCHGITTNIRRNSICLSKTTKYAFRISIRDSASATVRACVKGVVMEHYS